MYGLVNHLKWLSPCVGSIETTHTFDRLRQWRIQVPDHYMLCREVDETPEHLFLNCPYSRNMWLAFAELIGNVL